MVEGRSTAPSIHTERRTTTPAKEHLGEKQNVGSHRRSRWRRERRAPLSSQLLVSEDRVWPAVGCSEGYDPYSAAQEVRNEYASPGAGLGAAEKESKISIQVSSPWLCTEFGKQSYRTYESNANVPAPRLSILEWK